MSYKFYKWVMIVVLVIIGLLGFIEGTFIGFSITGRIIDAILYVIAIISLAVYLRKRFNVFKNHKQS